MLLKRMWYIIFMPQIFSRSKVRHPRAALGGAVSFLLLISLLIYAIISGNRRWWLLLIILTVTGWFLNCLRHATREDVRTLLDYIMGKDEGFWKLTTTSHVSDDPQRPRDP